MDSDVRLRRPNRHQIEFGWEAPDKLVEADHPVRLIWQVVEQLNLDAFTAPIQARTGVPGRDATDPRLLVALWLYATVRGIGSARELERRCREDRPFLWLCGGVTVNHNLLSSFRVGHADALDALFTQVVAALVKQDLVDVQRISQDGVRIRASAGEKTFRREASLQQLLQDARAHVQQLRRQIEAPQHGGGRAGRQAAAQERAARERVTRLEEALSTVRALQEHQEQAGRRLSAPQRIEQQKPPRASTTDPEARRMRMSDGGYRPAFNAQLAVDVRSRCIVGVDVTNDGTDYAHSAPLRAQIEQRTGRRVQEHLMDGGFVTKAVIEKAEANGVQVYAPPKPPRNRQARADGTSPRRGDSPAIANWRARMATPEAQQIYAQRAATSETVNADLLQHRGLRQVTVRGLTKVRCLALWAALAYNLLHYATQTLT